MKKKVSMLFAALLCLSMGLTGCGTNKENGKEDTKEELTKVTLNEVAHSVFYAPQYVAIEEGYFVEEGIKLELVTGFGADKVMSALLSGEADIGFMGSEATIYAYQQGANDKVMNFAQLTQSRKFSCGKRRNAGFSMDGLKGKRYSGRTQKRYAGNGF